jgi:hypothetical protein
MKYLWWPLRTARVTVWAPLDAPFAKGPSLALQLARRRHVDLG